MNVFVLLVLVLSCFSPAMAASHATIKRQIRDGDRRTLNKYCYLSSDHVAYNYGRDSAEKCAKFKEQRAQEKRDEEEKSNRVQLCRKAAGCGVGEDVSCSREVLIECEDTFGLYFQKRCIEDLDQLESINAMSDWFGPLKWIRRSLQETQTENMCGHLERR
jgi:hypothetical protein